MGTAVATFATRYPELVATHYYYHRAVLNLDPHTKPTVPIIQSGETRLRVYTIYMPSMRALGGPSRGQSCPAALVSKALSAPEYSSLPGTKKLPEKE